LPGGDVAFRGTPVVAGLRQVARRSILRAFVYELGSRFRCGKVAVALAVLAPGFQCPSRLGAADVRAVGFSATIRSITIRLGAADLIAVPFLPAGATKLRHALSSHRARELLDRGAARNVHTNVGYRSSPFARHRTLIDRGALGLRTNGLAIGPTRLIGLARGAVPENALLFWIHSHSRTSAKCVVHNECRLLFAPSNSRGDRIAVTRDRLLE
jgi:hypothetical protein